MTTLAPSFLTGTSSFFAGNKDNHKITNKFEIRPIRPGTAGLAALGRLEKSP